jgi:antirestriction protein ArdC
MARCQDLTIQRAKNGRFKESTTDDARAATVAERIAERWEAAGDDANAVRKTLSNLSLAKLRAIERHKLGSLLDWQEAQAAKGERAAGRRRVKEPTEEEATEPVGYDETGTLVYANPLWRAQRNPGNDSIFAKVTKRILDLMDSTGLPPWVKPWRPPKGGTPFPVNGSTGRAYSGVNVFILASSAMEGGYGTHEWWTAKQVEKVGGRILRKRAAQTVIFCRPVVVNEEGDIIRDADPAHLEEGQRVSVLTIGHQVWNRDDCDGLPPPRFSGPPLPDLDPLERAESLIAGNTNLPRIRHVKSDRVFYASDADFVQIPARGQFKDVAGYYGTLFHECIHSTGHPKRLDRSKILGQAVKFGDPAYSKEELVAEMGSSFLCALAGIENLQEELASAAYLKGWRKALKDDTRLVVQAAGLATKAADFIVDGAPAWKDAMPVRTGEEEVQANPQRHTDADGTLHMRVCRDAKGRILPNPGPRELVGLGRLVRLVVRHTDGSREAIAPEGVRFLAWDYARKDLVIADAVPGTGKLSPEVQARHLEFHGAAPDRAQRVALRTPGRMKCVGRVESITYATEGWNSPSKAGAVWVHLFGDVGERGHGPIDPDAPSPYPESVMPDLFMDRTSGLFIRRRRGNRYTVTDWIMA